MATSTNRLMDAVKNRLSIHLPGLAAGEGLPAVVQFIRYMPELAAIPNTPMVWCTIDTLRPGTPAGFGDGGSGMQTRFRNILVGVDVAGEDGETAQERLEAYADLIAQVLEGDQTMLGEAHRVRWMGTDYRAAYSPGMQLFGRALLRVEITRWHEMGED